MKSVIWIIALMLHCFTSNAKGLDLCSYMSISIKQFDVKGEMKSFPVTSIDQERSDTFGKELKVHFHRYTYLMTKHFTKESPLLALYPDTVKIKEQFCKELNQASDFRTSFELVCPSQYLDSKPATATFTKEEMMYVASRFFYCNKVTKDTGIIPKICVGINGNKMANSAKDLTSLEAIVFESLFEALKIESEEDPQFITDFNESILKSLTKNKYKYTNLDEMLLAIRNECFDDMAHNEGLEKYVSSYIESNKASFNFTVQ